jgi:hypothetical protein
MKPVRGRGGILRNAASASVAQGEQPERVRMLLGRGQVKPPRRLFLRTEIDAGQRGLETQMHRDAETGVPVAGKSVLRPGREVRSILCEMPVIDRRSRSSERSGRTTHRSAARRMRQGEWRGDA